MLLLLGLFGELRGGKGCVSLDEVLIGVPGGAAHVQQVRQTKKTQLTKKQHRERQDREKR